jgi:hypothetical protein
MDLATKPSTEDYDPTCLFFCIAMFHFVLMNVFFFTVRFCRRFGPDVEAGMSSPDLDGWLVHVAHHEPLPRYQDVIQDASLSYNDSEHMSLRVTWVEDGSDVDGQIVFESRSSVVA